MRGKDSKELLLHSSNSAVTENIFVVGDIGRVSRDKWEEETLGLSPCSMESSTQVAVEACATMATMFLQQET